MAYGNRLLADPWQGSESADLFCTFPQHRFFLRNGFTRHECKVCRRQVAEGMIDFSLERFQGKRLSELKSFWGLVDFQLRRGDCNPFEHCWLIEDNIYTFASRELPPDVLAFLLAYGDPGEDAFIHHTLSPGERCERRDGLVCVNPLHLHAELHGPGAMPMLHPSRILTSPGPALEVKRQLVSLLVAIGADSLAALVH